jgi:hypothetical protein
MHLQRRNSDQEGTRTKEDLNTRWGGIIENMRDQNVVAVRWSGEWFPGKRSIDQK